MSFVLVEGRAAVKGCFLITQLEMAFVKVQILFIQDGSPVASRDAWHAAD